MSYFVSAGDQPQVYYPLASPYVISVGGTTLQVRDNRRLSETAWSLAGGGCAAYELAHPTQLSFAQYGQTGCNGRRSTPDLAVVGDPAFGASVYTTGVAAITGFDGMTGWFVIAGTSLGAPMVAGWAATTRHVVDAPFIYGNTISFFDITQGSNGGVCLVGFDTCSGRGSFAHTDNGDG